MATAGMPIDQSKDVLTTALALLVDFMGQDEKFAITSQSLCHIANHLQSQLESVQPDQVQDLIDYWRAELPAVRRYLHELTREQTVTRKDGNTYPLLTEKAAFDLMSRCPIPPALPR